MKTKHIFSFSLAVIAVTTLNGQIPGCQNPPRREDWFQSNLTVNRIDFTEKMNSPMVSTMDPSIYESGPYTETNGVVAALIEGLKKGKYPAHDPNDLNKIFTWDEVTLLANNNDPRNTIGEDPTDPEDPFYLNEDPDVEDPQIDDPEGDGLKSGGSSVEGFSLAPYETVMEFIENKIIDKNRSDVVHDIQYIRLVWVDPSEIIPDKNFICLKYTDVLPILEQTMWTNKYNDAEARNMREVFELRLFNSFVTSVSGKGVRTLEEAEFRRNQLTEFEHNLWNY